MNRRRFLTGMAVTVGLGGFVSARVSAETLGRTVEASRQLLVHKKYYNPICIQPLVYI